MKRIIPFNNLVLVKELKTTTVNSSGIIMPEKYKSRFIRYIVLLVGSEVTWIKPGQIVIGNPTPEDEIVNQEGHKLINSKDLLAREEDDGRPVN